MSHESFPLWWITLRQLVGVKSGLGWNRWGWNRGEKIEPVLVRSYSGIKAPTRSWICFDVAVSKLFEVTWVQSWFMTSRWRHNDYVMMTSHLPTSISDIIFWRFILISDLILLQNGFGHIRLTQYRLSQIVTSVSLPVVDSDWLTNRSGRFDQRSLSNSHQFIRCLGEVKVWVMMKSVISSDKHM